MTVPPVQTFPVDGFADTCTGWGREIHGTNDVLGTGPVDSLCVECRARFLAETEQTQQIVTFAQRRQCPGGCTGHIHGTRYYDCLCCYGD